MRRAPKPLNRMGETLAAVLQRLDSPRNLRAYQVWSFWNDEVGPAIAQRAQPSQFRNGILIVTVASHSWLQELQFMKDDLRERLNRRLGEEILKDIYFVSGQVEAPPAAAPDKPAAATPAEPVEVPVLPDIADPQLAQAFARLAAARARHPRPARGATSAAAKPRRRR